MATDFPNAELPALKPLASSYTENQVEAELQALTIELFRDRLGAGVFDASVLGAAQLGSFELVRRAINADGLVLTPGTHEEPATRYLYRAWRAANMQGRGLHFLRTYLQLLFPGAHTIHQMLQDKGQPYPTSLTPYAGGPIPSDKYLTSRVEIEIDSTGNVQSVPNVLSCVLSVIPARFVVFFNILSSGKLTMRAAVAGSGTYVMHSYGALIGSSGPVEGSGLFTLDVSALNEGDLLGV